MSVSTSRKIRSLMSEQNLKTRKRFGQNYLIDDKILKKIVSTSQIDSKTLVIEIGPGLGSLTQYLVESAAHVLAYEIDESLVEVLQDMFAQNDNFTLISDDVLKRDMDADVQAHYGEAEKIIVVANLPYYITTPFIMKSLEESRKVDRYVLMLQLEVAKRLTASKNTKDYNALSVIMQYLTTPSFQFTVPNTVFIPRPKVDSAVITLDVKKSKYTLPETPELLKFVKACFKQRRKTLINNLHEAYGIDKETLKKFLHEQGFTHQIRAEAIAADELIKLGNDFLENDQCST